MCSSPLPLYYTLLIKSFPSYFGRIYPWVLPCPQTECVKRAQIPICTYIVHFLLPPLPPRPPPPSFPRDQLDGSMNVRRSHQTRADLDPHARPRHRGNAFPTRASPSRVNSDAITPEFARRGERFSCFFSPSAEMGQEELELDSSAPPQRHVSASP